jgi:cytochrome b
MRRPTKEISMKTESASPVDAPRRVLVWDAPVRVFHWLMVLSFAGAWLTAESERWQVVHVTLGSTMAGLIAFRVLWGLIGTRYARFASFVRGPRAVAGYLRSLLRGRPEHHVGHNPAGALAIVALLLLAGLVTFTGWSTYNDFGPRWLWKLHEGAASFMLALVGVHVAAVALASWLHRENLVGSMISGRKTVPPREGIRHAWRSVAAIMLVGVLGFWSLQWQSPVAEAVATVTQRGWGTMGHHVDDDD